MPAFLRSRYRGPHAVIGVMAAAALPLSACTTEDAPNPPPSTRFTTSPSPSATTSTSARPSPRPPTTSPTAHPSASPTTTNSPSLEAQCASGGYTVCGSVTKNGAPVSGVTIEFKFGKQHQTTTSNSRGVYAMHVTVPVTTAICIEPEALLDADLACGAVGSDGTPVSIDSAKVGRIVNFMFCPVDTNPSCLRRS